MKLRLLCAAIAASAVIPASADYWIHDSVSENSIGLTGTTPVSFFWGTNFTAAAGQEMITGVSVAFGTPAFPDPTLIGSPVTAFVMRANPDGTPMQGGLLASLASTVTSQGSDTMQLFDTPDVALSVGDRFMVGVVHNRLGTIAQFPAAIDQTAPVAGRNYAAFLVGAGIFVDPNNINGVPGGQRNYIEAFGLPGNWLVTAHATVPEPGTFIAIGIGLAVLALRRRK